MLFPKGEIILTAAYTIQETPNGMFRLIKGDASLDTFHTKEDAIAGMQRVIKKTFFYYDEAGTEISEAEAAAEVVKG